MEYISLAKKTLATTVAALAIATSTGCMGVGKAFTTFGPSKEEQIDANKEKKQELQYEQQLEKATKQYKQHHEEKQPAYEQENLEQKTQPEKAPSPQKFEQRYRFPRRKLPAAWAYTQSTQEYQG